VSDPQTGRNPITTFAVGVDPGDSTGLAIIRGDGFRLHVEQGPPFILDDFTVRFAFLLHPDADVLVACERFVVTVDTAKHSAQPTAQQTIGVVARLCRLNDWPLYMQAPSDVKALVTNALLTELGLKLRGRDVGRPDANDANDAQRHALAVLAHHRASMFDRLLPSTTM
jgi:hypothetical protein